MDEEELQQSMRALELYRAQLESFEQQIEFLSMTLQDHNRAKETMEGYKNLKESSETLIPVGGNSFLFAKVGVPDKAMVGIGGDIVIETDINDAISKMEERIKEIEGTAKNLGERHKEIEKKAADISVNVQKAYNRT